MRILSLIYIGAINVAVLIGAILMPIMGSSLWQSHNAMLYEQSTRAWNSLMGILNRMAADYPFNESAVSAVDMWQGGPFAVLALMYFVAIYGLIILATTAMWIVSAD